jgi:hypothetical protein
MATAKKYLPPEETKSDTAHAVARAVVGSIPVVGSAATELFNKLITPPLEKRRNKWMKEIGESLSKLEEAGVITLDNLQGNDVFIDVVMQASTMAIRNSHEEKHEALRNAVLNSALPDAPDESKQQMFINWIDELTSWHLRMLKLLSDPKKWYRDNNREAPVYHITSSLSQVLTNAYPELASQQEFYSQIGKELFAKGLLNTEGFHAMMSGSGAYEHRATNLGNEFLKFISAPVSEGTNE